MILGFANEGQSYILNIGLHDDAPVCCYTADVD